MTKRQLKYIFIIAFSLMIYAGFTGKSNAQYEPDLIAMLKACEQSTGLIKTSSIDIVRREPKSESCCEIMYVTVGTSGMRQVGEVKACWSMDIQDYIFWW